MNDGSEKLDQKIISDYQKAKQEADKFSIQIVNRINHILNEVIPQADPDFQLDWWDWTGGSKYHDGSIDLGLTIRDGKVNDISIECEWCEVSGSGDQDYDQEKWDYICEVTWNGLPELILLSDEEIVSKIKEELEMVLQSLEKERAKKEKAKIDKKKAKEAVLAKLSSEDRKALGM